MNLFLFLWARIMNLRQDYIKNSVFIIEDDQWMVDLYSDLLEIKDWKILAVSRDGTDAKRIYQRFPRRPEVVIVDLNINGCCGMKVAKEILNVNSSQKILFVSGQSEKLQNDSILKNYPRLQKPFRIPQFFELLNGNSDI